MQALVSPFDTTATKINALLDAISQDIAKHENVANSAMQTLEKLNATPEEFKENDSKKYWHIRASRSELLPSNVVLASQHWTNNLRDCEGSVSKQ